MAILHPAGGIAVGTYLQYVLVRQKDITYLRPWEQGHTGTMSSHWEMAEDARRIGSGRMQILLGYST